MVESPQEVYIAEVYEIQDEGTKKEVSLNTRGDTPSGARTKIYDRFLSHGIDPAAFHEQGEGTAIGRVWFNEDGSVERIKANPN